MSIKRDISRWLVPPAFHPLIHRMGLKARKDTNATISPVQLRHVRRYEFARKNLVGGTVLDAACGSGYGSDLLEPLRRYVGIDYADYCVRYAQAHYGSAHREFVLCDLDGVDAMFPSEAFDTVVCFETLEHLANPELVLRSLRGLLQSTGRMILSIPLNHPDLRYHKRRYTYDDVHILLREALTDADANLDEYFQQHLAITPLLSSLPPQAGGTWLGVLTFGSPNHDLDASATPGLPDSLLDIDAAN